MQDLVGKPKLFFIEACRGRENNFSTQMAKAGNPAAPCGISLPRYRAEGSSEDSSQGITTPLQQAGRVCGVRHRARLCVPHLHGGFALPAGLCSPCILGLMSPPHHLPMQALASQLADHHDTTDLADIHLLVKRKLAAMKIGEGGVCQVRAGCAR